MEQTMEVYLLVVFVAVVVISQTVLVSLGGTRASNTRILRKRMHEIANGQQTAAISLMRENYLQSLGPFERWLESSVLAETLRGRLDMAGLKWKAYRTLFGLLGLCLLSVLAGFILLQNWIVALLLPLVVILFFVLWLRFKAGQRLDKFEEQFVEALDVMRRALLVGYPLVEVFKTVSEEMTDPIASEFRKTYSELNYGVELRAALSGLAERNPTVSMLAFISAVVIQKETGGNLAENLDKLSKIIRGRFRFYRKVNSLSAEGRMSAWILALVPMVLFLALYLMQPEYLQPLVKTVRGHYLLIYSFFSLGVGLMIVKRILRIEV